MQTVAYLYRLMKIQTCHVCFNPLMQGCPTFFDMRSTFTFASLWRSTNSAEPSISRIFYNVYFFPTIIPRSTVKPLAIDQYSSRSTGWASLL